MSRMMMSSGSPSEPNMTLLSRVVRRGTAVIVPLFAVALAAGAAAQFTSGVSLVEVYTTVTDAQGRPIAGLTAADFHVSEDGTPQTITTFVAGAFPLSIFIDIDRSFTIGGA